MMNHTIDTHQLCLLITAVDRQVEEIEKSLSSFDPEESDYADMELHLMDYTNLAGSLKRMFQEAESVTSNLPSYQNLARFFSGD